MRDSILQARRADFVIDSLRKTGEFTEGMLSALRRFANGEGGFGGGGGGANRMEAIARLGPGGTWNARPGEGSYVGRRAASDTTRRADTTRTAAEAADQAAELRDLMNMFPNGFEEVRDLLKPPSQHYTNPNTSSFFGGARQAPVAPTGDYLVTLRVGSEVQRQVLRVEHVRDTQPVISSYRSGSGED
jgi:hypothetical protein